MTTQVDLAEAQAHLPDLLERATQGEDIVIAEPGRARVRLVPLPTRSEPRRPGRWKGRLVLGPGWDDDLTDEFEDI